MHTLGLIELLGGAVAAAVVVSLVTGLFGERRQEPVTSASPEMLDLIRHFYENSPTREDASLDTADILARRLSRQFGLVVLLTGTPGCGKSLLARELARRSAHGLRVRDVRRFWADELEPRQNGPRIWARELLIRIHELRVRADGLGIQNANLESWARGLGIEPHDLEAWAHRLGIQPHELETRARELGIQPHVLRTWAKVLGIQPDELRALADEPGAWVDGPGAWVDGPGAWVDELDVRAGGVFSPVRWLLGMYHDERVEAHSPILVAISHGRLTALVAQLLRALPEQQFLQVKLAVDRAQVYLVVLSRRFLGRQHIQRIVPFPAHASLHPPGGLLAAGPHVTRGPTTQWLVPVLSARG